jgi:hypothetical protein
MRCRGVGGITPVLRPCTLVDGGRGAVGKDAWQGVLLHALAGPIVPSAADTASHRRSAVPSR